MNARKRQRRRRSLELNYVWLTQLITNLNLQHKKHGKGDKHMSQAQQKIRKAEKQLEAELKETEVGVHLENFLSCTYFAYRLSSTRLLCTASRARF